MADSKSDDIILLEKFLAGLAGEIEGVLSTNIAISFYDIVGDFVTDESDFELKIATFFSGMPDKLVVLHKAIGSISIIRREIIKGGQRTEAKRRWLEQFFAAKSAELSEKWQKET